MEAGRLYRLIRQLRTVAGASSGETDTVSPSVIAVVEDLADHPDSSITEIVGRTGLVQSMVSTAVAQLRSDGVLRTSTDPKDRRRTLVTLAADSTLPRCGRSIDAGLRQMRPELDDDRRAEVVEHLERVAVLLGS